jgi:CRP-like cAMP-binding protein
MVTPPDSGNWFLAHLPQADRSLLDPHLQTILTTPDQRLHRAGEEHQHVILPHSGVVALGLPMSHGGLAETAIVGREGILGSLATAAAAPALYSSCVRVPGEVAQIPKAVFLAALDRSPRMRELAARCDAVLLNQIQQSAYCNGIHPVEARLCRWLLQVHDRCSSDRLPVTQDLLAQSLGVRRTTITLVAGQLQKAGGISWRRGYVQIVRRDYLEQHACECYRRVRGYLEVLTHEPLMNGHCRHHVAMAQLAP